jgi:hypothetical protein
MSVGGVGGWRAEQAEEAAPPALDPAARAAPVRGPIAPVPPEIARAVLAFDKQRYDRNAPDRKYGGVVDGRREADGSWVVRVGTFPTTFAGPRPGAKPFDVATYRYRKGEVLPE